MPADFTIKNKRQPDEQFENLFYRWMLKWYRYPAVGFPILFLENFWELYDSVLTNMGIRMKQITLNYNAPELMLKVFTVLNGQFYA